MKEFYDDAVGCVIQSLNDNYIDHCFSTSELERIKARFKKEGRGCFLYKKYLDRWGGLDYYKLIPVKCIRQDVINQDMTTLHKVAINSEDIPRNYKLISGMYRHIYVIKDFDAELNKGSLRCAIKWLESRDEE